MNALLIRMFCIVGYILGFNPSETKIRTTDGKVWQEAEFQNMSRELYRDLALHFAGESRVFLGFECFIMHTT